MPSVNHAGLVDHIARGIRILHAFQTNSSSSFYAELCKRPGFGFLQDTVAFELCRLEHIVTVWIYPPMR